MTSLSFYSSKNKPTLLGYFIILFIFEVCIGGSGRLIEIGALTLRKINFAVGIALSVFLVFYFKEIKRYVVLLISAFLISIIIPTILGFVNYGNDDRISENVLMQSFFLLLPLYSLVLKSERDIWVVERIIKFVSFFIAVVYITVLVLIATGVLNFLAIYKVVTQSPEFMGRGDEAFWFKGFLYLCIGLFFFDTQKSLILRRILQFIILVAVYFTYTRGFILAIFAALLLYQLLFKSLYKGVIIIVAILLSVGYFAQFYTSSSFYRAESDKVRQVQFRQVMAEVDPVSFFIGHGFGKGVEVSTNHMEINYLEVFHKQGILGLAFWFSLLVYICLLYRKCKQYGLEKKARPFLLATFFVYLQSATNPYLTNSIGMNMVMITIVALNVFIAEEDKRRTPNIEKPTYRG